MTRCHQQNYFDEYISGELEPEQEIDLIKHLQSCSDCANQLEEFYTIHRRLHLRKRPVAPPALRASYQNEMKTIFGRQNFFNRVNDRVQILLPKPLPWWRLAATTILLLAGVFVGRYLLQPEPVVLTSVPEMPYDWQQPVAKADVEYIGYYLRASEMILLEMENSTTLEPEILISQETAQKLLIKTFLVHETALKLKDTRLLRFLSKMELILYELANADTEEIEDSISAVRVVITRAQLLDEVKLLQNVFNNEASG